MAISDRRIARRFKLRVPLRFQNIDTHPKSRHAAKSINVSTSGVYFETDLKLKVGQVVEVRMRMPKRVAGKLTNERCFTGRVVHIEPKKIPPGHTGIGVYFLYYEAA
jgi:hypothetical protein